MTSVVTAKNGDSEDNRLNHLKKLWLPVLHRNGRFQVGLTFKRWHRLGDGERRDGKTGQSYGKHRN